MRVGRRDIPVPLTPREVREARLVPHEITGRWGCWHASELPPQGLAEYQAAQAAVAESEDAHTLAADYPQLFKVGPYDDLVSADGLTVHAWQL